MVLSKSWKSKKSLRLSSAAAAISCLFLLAACGDDSSSAGELNCSAMLEGEEGWNWNIPKECRFNSEITYGTLTDSRDGQVYKTVTIGSQTWMAENLNYADSTTTLSLNGKSWCYDDKDENCAVTGRLYTWAAAIDSVTLYDGGNGVDCGYGKNCLLSTRVQGICPPGWHLPTDMEWETLITEVGGSSAVGKMLKSQTGWSELKTQNVSGEGTDDFGFSALPAGMRYNDGSFQHSVGYNAYFWSATEYNGKSNGVVLNSDYNLYSGLYPRNDKSNGLSVRCLQD